MGLAIDHLRAVLTFLLFVAAPVPLGLFLAALTKRERSRLTLPAALLLVLALWCVAQALVAHVLGVVHQLRLAGTMVAEIVVLGAGMWGMKRLTSRCPPSPRTAWRRGLARADPFETITMLALSLMGFTVLWWSAAMPVVDWDSWAFHMPHMAEWLQSGTFTRMAQGAERPRNWYPYGWEALCTLFLTPFGEDMLVTFPNLVAWALLGLATYQLARLFRARRVHALNGAALLLAIHYVADPVNTMHVDLPFAALFTAAAYLGAVWARSGDGVSLGLCAAIIGLACATRTTGPFYALLLAGWVLFVHASGPRDAAPRRTGRAAALIGIGAGTGLALFWYVKNLIDAGHPLGAGRPIAGPETETKSWAYLAAQTLVFNFHPLRPASWQAVADRAFHELDAPFVALVMMAALWPLARAGTRPEREPSGRALALLLLATGVAFAFTPLSGLNGIQARLGLPFLAILAVAAAVGATRARLHPAVPVAFTVISAARTFSGSRVLFPLMLVAVAWGVWAARARDMPSSRRQVLTASAALVLLLGLATWTARARRERERQVVYGPFYDYLEQHVSPDAPVAYLLSHRPYLFYGRRLARSVIYAPLAADQPVEDWIEPLRRQQVGIVVVGPWNGNDPSERATLARLVSPNGPLVWVGGSRAANGVGLYVLTPPER